MNFFTAMALTILFSIQAFGKATIHIPLFIDGDRDNLSAVSVNTKLKAAGLATIPVTIKISSDERNVGGVIRQIDRAIATAIIGLGSRWQYRGRVWENYPGENNRRNYFTCYEGDPKDLSKVVKSLINFAYSDQLSILGEKYGSTTEVTTFFSENRQETLRYLRSKSPLWSRWRGFDSTVLIVSSYSDSGNDINESVIPVCE